jgi:predicted nucleotidyltransferase
MGSLAEIIGSRTRAEVFRLLFVQPGIELYLRDLQRRSGVSIRPIQQELAKLQSLGLIKARKDGNRTYFSSNTSHPLYPEIRGLVEKTSGYLALLTEALTHQDIQIAFVFGSVAAGTETHQSDLDLFVVVDPNGNLGLRKLTKLLSGLTDRIGREINPQVMTSYEFVRKLRAKDHFVSSVVKSARKFIIGDENELKRLGEERLAESP